jgi:hypothetical protein
MEQILPASLDFIIVEGNKKVQVFFVKKRGEDGKDKRFRIIL